MTHTREHRWAKSDQRDRGNKAQHDARGTRGKKQTLRQKPRRTNVTQAGSKHGRPNGHRLEAGNTGTQAYNIANNENYEHRIWTRTQTENIQQKLKVSNAGSWNCPQIISSMLRPASLFCSEVIISSCVLPARQSFDPLGLTLKYVV